MTKLTVVLHFIRHRSARWRWFYQVTPVLFGLALLTQPAGATPKTILISLDGATPRLVDQFSSDGTLPPGVGLRLLEESGVKAARNFTISPSLTAPGHIAIATGATATNNDVVANASRLVATPNSSSSIISGFGAPIGGYSVEGPAETDHPTAHPLWLPLREAGKVVATATWPGGDGIDVFVPGLTNSPIIQSADKRTVDFTVPFGSATFPFQHGFPLTIADFADASQSTVDDLEAAGHHSFSPVKQADLETFASGGQTYDIKLAAIDSSDDGFTNYDTLAFFDVNHGSILGPFTPAPLGTGPACIQPSVKISSLFYLEDDFSKAGVRYFLTALQPDLSTVRVARSSTTFIPRNSAVLADVDDINNNVGFWQPQPDFRIIERIDAVPSTFATFPDIELEAIYEELVKEFSSYQTRVALRALERFPDADLLMIYIEQPDGSEHQFFLVDSRQATDPTDPNSIGNGQDPEKIARYQTYLATAYQTANNAVQSIIDAVGVNENDVPNSNIFVVSDHGFSPFHTAVSLQPILEAAGIDVTKLHFVTSGPAANVYINLEGRPDSGSNTVTREEYFALQKQIFEALQNFVDTNPIYIVGGTGSVHAFHKVYRRPLPASPDDPTFGVRRSNFVAQDSGDVYAILTTGYNFDGRQTTPVTRQGDASNVIFSVPNFYGAHGYDPTLLEMSAIFYAAGPEIIHQVTPLHAVSNIDVAPTIMRILAVPPAATVEGHPLLLGPAPMTLLRAVSRKTHGTAGARDIVLPLAPELGVEPRQAGNGDSHTLVFEFSNDPVNGTASVTSGNGMITGAPIFAGREMIVTVVGVTDVQTLGVTVSDVVDTNGNTAPSVTVNAVFLLGDVVGDRTVIESDLDEVRSLSRGPALSSDLIRGDVDVDGEITRADGALVRANLGHMVE